ncbi:unnamed protein product [Orchesella dallaii]|uniref:Uncharacterized protein n=1 Tax=Orchesella dallaii TaxID=48710 RepID=A0ABP1QNG3_9HEXA
MARAHLIAAFGIIMMVGVAVADLQTQCIGTRNLPMDGFTRKCCDELHLRCEGGSVPNPCQSCKTNLQYYIDQFDRCCGGLGTHGKTFNFNPWEGFSKNPIGNAPPPGTLVDVTKYNPYPNINPLNPTIPGYPNINVPRPHYG